MIDVVLINPPNSFDEVASLKKKGFVLYPPLGILYIASACERMGLKPRIVDVVSTGNSIEDILKLIDTEKVRLVGMSATTPQIRGSIQLAQKIKQRFDTEVTIGIGGAHVSADPAFMDRFDVFDFAIIGEGEEIFPRLVKAAGEGHIKGVYYGERLTDLDSLAFPSRHLMNQDDYYIQPYGKYFATIHTARGCPFNCSFCSNPVTGRKTRFRSPENVVDEIEYCIREFGIRFVLFTDDTFTLNMERTARICEEILRRDIKVLWGCETNANLVNGELIELMHKSGCREIAFGVESGNGEIRSRILRKKVSDDDLVRAFAKCRRSRVETSAFCMLGFPEETRENMLQTLEFALRIKPDVLGVHLTVLLPGADLYLQAINEGKISQDIWDRYAKGKIEAQPVYVPNSLSRQTMEAIQKYIYRRYYFRLSYLVHRFFKDIASFPRFKQDLRLSINLLFSPRTRTGRP